MDHRGGCVERVSQGATGRVLPPSRAANRDGQRTHAKTLLRREWDDLDVLCLTAMAPDPAQRYATVNDLLGDLNAFQQGLPLQARAPSHWYASAKFLRRHRSAALATAAVVLTYLLGSLLLRAAVLPLD